MNTCIVALIINENVIISSHANDQIFAKRLPYEQ